MTPGESQKSLEFLPEIDLHNALNRMMGSRQLLTDLLREFSEKYAGFSNSVKNALANNDLENAKSLVHTFKGSSGTLSLENLYCAAVKIECALEIKNFPLADLELSRMDEILIPLLLAINSLPSENEEELTSSDQNLFTNTGRNELTWLLVSLSDSLTRHNLKAVKQLAECKKLFRGTPYNDTVREMESLMKKLDFNSAKICLDAIAAGLGIDLY